MVFCYLLALRSRLCLVVTPLETFEEESWKESDYTHFIWNYVFVAWAIHKKIDITIAGIGPQVLYFCSVFFLEDFNEATLRFGPIFQLSLVHFWFLHCLFCPALPCELNWTLLQRTVLSMNLKLALLTECACSSKVCCDYWGFFFA